MIPAFCSSRAHSSCLMIDPLLSLQFGSLLVSVLLTSPTVGAKTKNLRKLARGEQRFLSSAVLDFSAFSSGTVVSALSNGVTVVAMKKTSYNSSLFPGQAMILNSTSPSTYEVDLGTPSQSFGGPGKGKGGKLGKLFANKVAHGNVLIISEDENASNPDDCTFGGTLNFRFDPPRYVESIGLINNVGKREFAATSLII